MQPKHKVDWKPTAAGGMNLERNQQLSLESRLVISWVGAFEVHRAVIEVDAGRTRPPRCHAHLPLFIGWSSFADCSYFDVDYNGALAGTYEWRPATSDDDVAQCQEQQQQQRQYSIHSINAASPPFAILTCCR